MKRAAAQGRVNFRPRTCNHRTRFRLYKPTAAPAKDRSRANDKFQVPATGFPSMNIGNIHRLRIGLLRIASVVLAMLTVAQNRAPSLAQQAPPPPASGTNASPAQFDTNRLAAVDAHIIRYMREHRIPGVAISVVQGTNLVFAKGYGDGITPQTPFKLASVSKSFTALAVMQLVEAGKLDLDAPVRTYLPWFRTADEVESGKITLRHLLHHTSGFATRHRPRWEGARRDRNLPGELDPRTVEGLVRNFSRLHLTAPVGSQFEYSNVNYEILGAVVEVVSGEEFGDYVRNRIFGPLEMNRSHVSFAEARQQGMLGHRYWFGHPARFSGDDLGPEAIASGGLVSTVEDLSHYLTALLKGGQYRGRSILSPAGVETLFQKQAGRTNTGDYALGWIVQDPNPSHRAIWHDGDAAGHKAFVALVPMRDLGFSVLINANSFTSPVMFQLCQNTAEILMGVPPRQMSSDPAVVGVTWTLIVLPILQLLGLWRTVVLLRQWHSGTPPPGTPLNWVRHWGLPLLVNGFIAVVTLWLLPRHFDITFSMFLIHVPDYGILAALSGSLALVWGVVRSILVGKALRGGERNRGNPDAKTAAELPA